MYLILDQWKSEFHSKKMSVKLPNLCGTCWCCCLHFECSRRWVGVVAFIWNLRGRIYGSVCSFHGVKSGEDSVIVYMCSRRRKEDFNIGYILIKRGRIRGSIISIGYLFENIVIEGNRFNHTQTGVKGQKWIFLYTKTKILMWNTLANFRYKDNIRNI